MEEDTIAKAPVTRLRRRLSVEQTEEKTSTPNTPTKKRTRQTKPQLDLIDENAVTPQKSTPKRITRKTAKDALEPVEDKPVTPSRRSARIKSNTSIVSDTAPVDTPKAKRVTRRHSQLGSDTEAPLTPTRQTRRTRKDSSTSLDKVDAVTKPSPITDIITEEPENVSKKSTSATETLDKSQSNCTSPWNDKDKIQINISVEVDAVKPIEDIHTDCDAKESEIINTQNETSKTIAMSPDIQKENISPHHDQKLKLSESAIHLINNVDLERCPKKDVMNKTTSFLETNVKRNIKRTKSWSTICTMSDEHPKVNNNKNIRNKSLIDKINSPVSNNKGSGDGISIPSSPQNKSPRNVCKDVVVVLDRLNVERDSNLSSEQLFEKEPSENSKPEIIIEDTESKVDTVVNNNEDTEDQCVPVISVNTVPNKNISINESNTNVGKNVNNSNEIIQDDSVEPMDIDQTIPESLIIAEPDEKESSCNVSENKDMIAQRNSLSSKSRRKSSLSQACDKTENKSTLILSEIKDISSTESNKLGKSPLPSNDKSLSKSITDLDKTQTTENYRKNLSLTCLTSTPLQQKQFHKLAAPGNTSIIKANDNIQDNIKSSLVIDSPLKDKSKINLNDDEFSNAKNEQIDDKASDDNTSKNKSLEPNEELLNNESSEKNSSKTKTKKTSEKDESSENDTSSDESRTKNELINDEASDAGDDYESGDSQDEDQLQYAKENEIFEKGETLTSEDELPDDSDYEKDSFVVSSDEDDNILLEGTDDDLSMSDNELKISTKSKIKYNERMAKEQKKASREMFEARHKLNKSKKHKNKIDDSSDSSDSDKTPKKQKQSNRMRLDSSHETSVLNESTKTSTEDAKRLSKSVCNESILNEKEITAMHNESTQESDPLATSIKKEPKTPKKEINTTLDFISIKPARDINETQDNDISKHENSQDPLIISKNDESSSSDSDTNNIIDHYESVLNDLNKVKSPKTCDISLNLELKNKHNKKTATIIDELNLTQVKSGKLTKKEKLKLKQNASNLETSIAKIETPTQDKVAKKTSPIEEFEDDSSSDSIDLHLLISEDSNTDSITLKINEDKDTIPLKHAEAKTDIRINKNENDEEDGHSNFFIDTKGANNIKSFVQNPEIQISNMSTDNGEKLNVSSAKKKKNKNLTESLIVQDEETAINEITMTSASNIKTPESKKKKKQRLSEVQIDDVTDSPMDNNVSEKRDDDEQNISIVKSPKSDKKKKKKLLKSQADNNIEDKPSEHIIEDVNISSVKTPKSDKKKKRQSSELKADNSEDVPVETFKEQDDSITIAKTPKSDRKMKKLSASLVDSVEDPIVEEIISKGQNVNVSTIKTPKSDKKKKKLLSTSQSNISEVESTEQMFSKEFDGNESRIKTPKSEKKKKKLLAASQTDLEDLPIIEIISKDQDPNVSGIKTPKSDKQKNKRLSKSTTDSKEGDENNSFNKSLNNTDSGKKAKKISESQEVQEKTVDKDPVKDDLVSSKKRKRSLTTQPEDILTGGINPLQPNGNGNKKRKISDTVEEIIQTAVVVKKNKKRKEREDDESIPSEVQQGSSHKLTIPRLPLSVIEQLDEKPKMQVKKKPKVISTSQFEVQDVRRKKPSNYLEESVYLNDDSPEKKKQKKNIRKPKVLPTMPTCSSSNSGFTTNFKINVLPKETKFVAQVSANAANFRENRLYNKTIKRLGTYELYKKQRSLKLSKF